MRVLFQPRIQNFLNTAGGGLKRQVLKTREFLEKAGVKVDISLRFDDKLDHYDVVHLFSPDTYFQALNTKKYHTPVVLSTIYWVDQYETETPKYKIKSRIMQPYHIMKSVISTYSQREYRKELFRQNVADVTIDALTQHRTVLAAADLWLPNGIDEYRKIVDNTGLEKEYRIIFNAIDETMLTIAENPVPLPDDDYALCVAAVTPRKNQLKLIKIANELGINLVLAGSIRPGGDGYFEQCQQEARSNTVFLGELTDSQLAYVYRRAKIHVLASIYETPGLSSLEAALFGCPIVSTKVGAVYEYFRDDAFYCDPYDYGSIRDSVEKAWNSRRDEVLKKRVVANFTWSEVARTTRDAYRMLLERGK